MAGSSRLLAVAREALAAGDLPRAAAVIAEAHEGGTPRDRAELLRIRAQLALAGAGAGPDAYRELVAEADVLAGEEPLLCGLTLADAAGLALYRNEPDVAMPLLDRARALVGDDEAARRYVSIITGATHTFLGEMDAATSVLEQAITPFGDTGSVTETAQALQSVVIALASLEHYAGATSVAQRAVAAARRVGAVGILPLLLCLLANSAYYVGDYDTVLVAAGEASDLAASTDQPAMVLFAAACSALAHAVRGHDAEVKRHVATVRELVPTAGLDAFLNTVLVAEGQLALGAQDDERAMRVYDDLDRRLEAMGRRTGLLQWSADHIETLHRAGRTDDARRALTELEEAIGDLPLSWSQSVVARCRGLLATDDWDRHFADAVARWPAGSSPYELGRTHLAWSRRAQAAGQVNVAHAHAEQARTLFESVAAPRWIAQAEALLAAPVAGVVERADVVEVRAFGPLTIVRGNVEQLVPLDAGGRLMRYLVAVGGSAATEHAVEVLWPELAEGVGATRMRNLLSRLRRQWGEIVVREGAMLRWADGVVVDVDMFEYEARAALATDDVALARRAVERYRGELMPAVRFADWSTLPRERTRRSLVRLLRLMADDEARSGATDAAVAHLQRAIDTDTYDEGHYLRAAEILLDAGRPGAARRYLDRADAIAEELGVEPSTELERLRGAVLRSG